MLAARAISGFRAVFIKAEVALKWLSCREVLENRSVSDHDLASSQQALQKRHRSDLGAGGESRFHTKDNLPDMLSKIFPDGKIDEFP